mmetsp:Transcript_53964/g.110119  ORF Transcript_53964/g.110119 Transcript_53964/m.110119 type:complete len:538 (+) Transcript_53964:111-1724(+)|eukprot:CAMPEP_0181306748 /NCGR_PEP_ID=MMETSP1101-20121128/10481_1 /TAXON_ID=46948 /ORGANISM="Rhodomonas abbreviata, Strain Caron Lab Isolate" /LENGTH=537 /DNA_ID=CAMNT_0023412857 /DNA_START=110 /DNA_END=1723 /DNA_ORIENTATION=-
MVSDMISSASFTIKPVELFAAGAAVIVGCWLRWYWLSPRIVRKVVRPRQSFPPDAIESLGGEDLIVGRLRTKFGLRFGSLLDPQRIEAALVKTLDVFPCVSGRLDQDSLQSSSVPFISQFHAGVVLEVLDDHVSDISQLRLSGLWGQAHGFQDDPLAFPSKDAPLFRARLASFHRSGISILFVDFAHLLGDMTSYANFLKVWSHFAAASDEPVPRELHPQPINARRRRLTKQHGYSVQQARQALKDGGEGAGTAQLLSSLVGAVLGSKLWNRTMQLRVNSAELMQLKESVIPKMQEGLWASTFETMVGSFLFARALAELEGAAGAPAMQKYAAVKVAVNLRGKVAEDEDAFPSHLFGNPIAWAELDLAAVLEEVRSSVESGEGKEEGTSKEQARLALLAKVVERVHSELRRGMTESGVLCEMLQLVTAGQELLPAPEFLDGVLRLQNKAFIEPIAGRGVVFNEWTSSNVLDVDFGSPSPSTGFVPMPSLTIIPNLHVLFPLDASADGVLPCCLPSRQAELFLRVVREWQLPFELIAG